MTDYRPEEIGHTGAISNYVPPATPAVELPSAKRTPTPVSSQVPLRSRRLKFGLQGLLLTIGAGSALIGYLSLYESTQEFIFRANRDKTVKAYVEMRNTLGGSRRYIFTDTNGTGVPDTIIEEKQSPFDTFLGIKPVTTIYHPSDGKRPSRSLVQLGARYVAKPTSVDEENGGLEESLKVARGLGTIVDFEQEAHEEEREKDLNELEQEFKRVEQEIDDVLGE